MRSSSFGFVAGCLFCSASKKLHHIIIMTSIYKCQCVRSYRLGRIEVKRFIIQTRQGSVFKCSHDTVCQALIDHCKCCYVQVTFAAFAVDTLSVATSAGIKMNLLQSRRMPEAYFRAE